MLSVQPDAVGIELPAKRCSVEQLLASRAYSPASRWVVVVRQVYRMKRPRRALRLTLSRCHGGDTGAWLQ